MNDIEAKTIQAFGMVKADIITVQESISDVRKKQYELAQEVSRVKQKNTQLTNQIRTLRTRINKLKAKKTAKVKKARK